MPFPEFTGHRDISHLQKSSLAFGWAKAVILDLNNHHACRFPGYNVEWGMTPGSSDGIPAQGFEVFDR